MNTKLTPYINFKDNARDAFTFYQSVLGGELSLNTFGEFHASDSPDEQDKIMHAMLATEAGLTLMGADTPDAMEFREPWGFSISLTGSNGDELRGYYEKLSADGGQVLMPLEKQVWGDEFGMVKDKFGVSWMVNISEV